jgi:uncharacterized protein YdhG (YjbR/CyaY superfamily)
MEREAPAATVDEYIASFPPGVRRLLKQLRTIIREAAPQAQEKISYRMPAYALNGVLVYFAAHPNHIGFYPGGVVAQFKEMLSKYKTSKGTIQFPLDKPLPVALIRKIVKYRASQNLAKAATAR